MILFFGTRPGKKVTKVLNDVTCPYCNQTGTLTAVAQPNYAQFVLDSTIYDQQHPLRGMFPLQKSVLQGRFYTRNGTGFIGIKNGQELLDRIFQWLKKVIKYRT